jgi:methylenetetrahydrofolate dehydrogenase (NADP+)/methenyltetrahydrofolate cyclohydrolase
MITRIIDPAEVARAFRVEIRAETATLPPLTLAGVLAADAPGPAVTYAEYTRKGCDDVGVGFDLRRVPRLEAEAAIRAANADPGVHGIFIYYPIFHTQQDTYLRDLVEPMKDVEGMCSFWARALFENRRFIDRARTKKAILPCTPLAILKLLDAAEQPLAGRRAVIFNRSEVVGRPLAAMMANDGADVISFDVDGPLRFEPGGRVSETPIDRRGALAEADVVVTGVPSASFPLVSASEIKPGAACINFSTFKNFSPDIEGKAGVFIPRVGPMTVTMALRNTVRLFRHAP